MRRLTTTTALLTVALAFTCRGVAQAATSPVSRAIAIADVYWGASPCNGADPIIYEPEPASSEVDAGAAQAALASGQGRVAMWAKVDDPTCTIHINNSFWTPEVEPYDFQLLCDEITHEIGHFLGYADEGQTDTASITYPIIEAGSANYDAVPGCVEAKQEIGTAAKTAHHKRKHRRHH